MADSKLSALRNLTPVAVPKKPSTNEQTSDQQPAADTPKIPLAPASNQEPSQQHTGPDPDASRETLSIRAPKNIIDAYERHRNKTKLSYPNILLNAVDATYDKLPALLATNTAAVPGRDLFGRGPSVQTLDDDTEDKVIKTMRMKKSHMQIIDKLTQEYSPKNRNRLIVTALTEYLKEELT